MFANFIHLIIALLTLSLYEPVESTRFSLVDSLLIFFFLIALFSAYTQYQFKRLVMRAEWDDPVRLDHDFSMVLSRHTIFALVLFAVSIWGLHLPTFLEPVQWLSRVPTVKMLMFLLLFVVFLTLIWLFAYDAHHRIYRPGISRWTYIYSNIAFTVPILIPWALLFGFTDLIGLLPMELPKRILDTQGGQIGSFLLFLFIVAIFAPVLIQRFWRCRPLAQGSLRERIEALCRRANIGYANIVHWPIFGGRMITAGVMGLVSKFRYIMVTEGLLQMLTPEQIDQVIAHEIGHVKHKHLLFYLFFFIGVMLIPYIVFPLVEIMLFSQQSLILILTFDIDIKTVYSVLTSALLIAGIVIYFRYIFGYFMRNFERQADVYVFQLFPTSQPLIETFNKITATSGQPADKPNWHHFSIQQRIDYLRLCENSTKWIHRHNQKIKRSILVMLIGFLFIGAFTFQLNRMAFNKDNRSIQITNIENYLVTKEHKTAKDGLLYFLLGDFYFFHQNYRKAKISYEAALTLIPNNAEVLNNFAWLLSGGDESTIMDPPRALRYAQHALSLKKEAHIYDTLALALFSNGRIQEAIEAEKKALTLNPADRHIYEAQLKKFREALDR